MPNSLLSIAKMIDITNEKLGALLMWLALFLVLVQFSIVILAHVFHVGFIAMQELLFYLNSLMFLGGAGFTLLHDEHVRVDVFYNTASARTKNIVNLVGGVFLLSPMLILIWLSATPFVLNSWRVLEGSIETSGIEAVYILKSFILFFALTLSLQAISLIIRALNGLLHKGEAHD